MQEQVVFQIRVFAEPSVAYVTLERPRSVVHVHVRFQITGRWERLGAQSAFMRFLLRTYNEKLLNLLLKNSYYLKINSNVKKKLLK